MPQTTHTSPLQLQTAALVGSDVKKSNPPGRIQALPRVVVGERERVDDVGVVLAGDAEFAGGGDGLGPPRRAAVGKRREINDEVI